MSRSTALALLAVCFIGLTARSIYRIVLVCDVCDKATPCSAGSFCRYANATARVRAGESDGYCELCPALACGPVEAWERDASSLTACMAACAQTGAGHGIATANFNFTLLAGGAGTTGVSAAACADETLVMVAWVALTLACCAATVSLAFARRASAQCSPV
jgi:hypothetical protein